MRILLTGSTGFIGINLLKRLSNKYEIIALVRSSSNTELIDDLVYDKIIFSNEIELKKNIMQYKIEGIIHLASLYLKKHESEDVKQLIDTNIKFPTQILEASLNTSVKWFVNTSTFWEHYENSDYSPLNLYAATKKSFENLAKYYIETSNIKFVTLKLCDTFGPNDTRPKIMNLWQKNGNDNKVLKMSGGDQLINISYIENVIDAYQLLIEQVNDDEILLENTYCVSSDEIISLKKLYQIFYKATGIEVQIEWGYYPYSVRENMIPWNKGLIVDGWYPKINVLDGIKKSFN